MDFMSMYTLNAAIKSLDDFRVQCEKRIKRRASINYQTPLVIDFHLGEQRERALLRNGICTIYDLAEMNVNDLMKLPSFGRKTIEKINTILADNNLPPISEI